MGCRRGARVTALLRTSDGDAFQVIAEMAEADFPDVLAECRRAATRGVHDLVALEPDDDAVLDAMAAAAEAEDADDD